MIKTIKRLFLVLSILAASCTRQTHDTSTSRASDSGALVETPPLPCEDYGRPLEIVSNKDTLKILIEASDCGEWGGHKESIYLVRQKHYQFRHEDDDIIARLIVDSVDCDKIAVKNGFGHVDDKTRRVILDTSALLNAESEKTVSIFLQRLLELHLSKEIDSNAGTVYHVISTDSTLDFTYWNSGDCRETNYQSLKKQLFGKGGE